MTTLNAIGFNPHMWKLDGIMAGNKVSQSAHEGHLNITDKARTYSRAREALVLSLLALVVFLIYANTLECPFVFDDVRNIRNNPHIRLAELTWDGLMRAGFDSPSSNRPVANISFALNYYFHGYDIRGYHVVNILIHIATGLLLYALVRTTLGIPWLASQYGSHSLIPLFTAGIWLVHPANTQSVTYLVQRMNSMAAMFYVLALLLYARARLSTENTLRWIHFSGCALSGLLALGSKEIAATLPLFIFVYEWFFFQELDRTWLKRYALRFAVVLGLLVLVGLVFLGTEASQKKLGLYDAHDFTMPQRVLTEFRVVVYYLSLLMYPHPSRLNLEYNFPVSFSLVDPITTLLSMGAVFGLLVLALYMAKRERLLSFCILWFLGTLVIESSVIGLALIYEHRTYLPSMMVVLLGVILANRYIRPGAVTAIVLCGVMALYALWAYERNRVWSDEVAFWEDGVKKTPHHAGLHNNLANALEGRGRYEAAIDHYREALRIDPLYAEAHNNLGLSLARLGRYQEAISHYKEALRIRPDYAEAQNNLGLALADQGSVDASLAYYEKALQNDPDSAEAHNNLGVALARQGNVSEAIKHYETSLRIDPAFASAYTNLGLALKSQGRHTEAIRYFKKALHIQPDSVEAYNNLANALAAQGKLNEAIDLYTKALKIKPDAAKAHNNLGVALARQGKFKAAVGHFSEALRIDPDFTGARRNLERGLREMEKASGR